MRHAVVEHRRVEIRIGFPERREIAVGQPRIAPIIRLIDRVATAGETVAPGQPDRRSRHVAGGPIPLPGCRIAPLTVGVPVPRFDPQLGPQSIAEGAQARAFHSRDIARGENAIDPAPLSAIDGGAQGEVRAKRFGASGISAQEQLLRRRAPGRNPRHNPGCEHDCQRYDRAADEMPHWASHLLEGVNLLAGRLTVTLWRRSRELCATATV